MIFFALDLWAMILILLGRTSCSILLLF